MRPVPGGGIMRHRFSAPFPVDFVHPRARWDREPARGALRRRAEDAVGNLRGWRAGRVGPYCWEITYEVGVREGTWICWRRHPEPGGDLLTGFGLYRWSGAWSFAALTKRSQVRWGGKSPYSAAGGNEILNMVMRP